MAADDYFENFPEFIDLAVRKSRYFGPITAESLNNRHTVMLPNNVVNNATVLDLGSCVGTSGHWCLGHGALHYTGVEIQKPQYEISKKLLSSYWTENQFELHNTDIVSFLDDAVAHTKKYDIILLIGVIYTFLNHYSLLEKICQLCDRYIIIDSIYPFLQFTGTVDIGCSFI